MFSIQAMELEADKQESPTANQPLDEVTHPKALQLLLLEFKELFAKTSSLVPNRAFDHSIHLKPNSELVNIRSYHYPPYKR